MGNTTAEDVYESFESSFQDKEVIPVALEKVWLLKAIGRYSVELDELNFDSDNDEFNSDIGRYAVDTLAHFMKEYYQERYVSKVNKRISIVGKDISIDGNNGSKTAAKNELDYDKEKSDKMIFNQKPTAYA